MNAKTISEYIEWFDIILFRLSIYGFIGFYLFLVYLIQTKIIINVAIFPIVSLGVLWTLMLGMVYVNKQRPYYGGDLVVFISLFVATICQFAITAYLRYQFASDNDIVFKASIISFWIVDLVIITVFVSEITKITIWLFNIFKRRYASTTPTNRKPSDNICNRRYLH